MAGLSDWANFYFLGKFFKNLGRFFSWVIFYFSGAKNKKLLISEDSFTIGQHWFFKSVHLATNTLYLMLEHFFKKIPQKKNQSPVTEFLQCYYTCL